MGDDGAGKRPLIGRAAKGAAGAVFLALLGIQIFSGALGETSSAKAVRLLVSGEAAAYEQEYQDRLRILEDDSVQDVAFEPYRNRPDMLYVGDFAGAQAEASPGVALYNRTIAQYFHKRTLYANY